MVKSDGKSGVRQTPLGLLLISENFGSYRPENITFSSGLSTLILARHIKTNERYFIKVFDPKRGRGDVPEHRRVWRTRFDRESLLLSTLNHPNIIQHIDNGETREGHPFLILPFYPANLVHEIGVDPGIDYGFARRRQANALPVGRTLKLLREVLSGMAELHRHGIVHRDLKPSNILLTRKAGGAAVIADLGLALVPGEPPDAEESWVGTPRYLAPEQKGDADKVDARADVYSLGVLAFRLLTAQLPDPAQKTATTACPKCPEWLDRLIFQCLSPDPRDRPASAEEMLKAIERDRALPAAKSKS